MKRHAARDCTNEELDAWIAAKKRDKAIAAAADEEGGPRLSLVPVTDREAAWPTDLLPPAVVPSPSISPLHSPSPDEAPVAGADADADAANDESAAGHAAVDPAVPSPAASIPAVIAAEPFDGVALEDSRKRLAGWSAERQRLFLSTLAETGSVHLASTAARLSARSAYKLRARSPAFAATWDTAEQLAVGRLAALAFDRAINGRVEQLWEDGELVSEKRIPSERLLMWLLARLDPRRFAAPSEQRSDGADPQAAARLAFPTQLDALTHLAADGEVD